MPEKRRNLWILLTMIAVVFVGMKWVNQSKRRVVKKKTCVSIERIQPKKSPCGKWNRYEQRLKTPRANDFVFVHQKPVLLNGDWVKRKIRYGHHCNKRTKGFVVLRVLVDENGRYMDHRLTTHSNSLLANRCETYASQLYFSPAIKDGNPVRYWTNVSFHF